MLSSCILITRTAYSETNNKGPVTVPFSTGHVGPTNIIKFGTKAKIFFRHIQVYTIFTAYK